MERLCAHCKKPIDGRPTAPKYVNSQGVFCSRECVWAANAEKNEMTEVDYLFVRLQQIAPRAVKLYSRQACEENMPAFRRAMEFWERENDKIVTALKRSIGIVDASK